MARRKATARLRAPETDTDAATDDEEDDEKEKEDEQVALGHRTWG